MGSVRYRSRAIDKPLAVYKVLVWLMIVDRKGRGAREKMQRISLPSTGVCTGLPISVYGQEGGQVKAHSWRVARDARDARLLRVVERTCVGSSP